jgi:hypothetical protein
MRRTTSSLALAGLLTAAVFGIAGCGDGDSGGGTDTPTSAEEQQQEEAPDAAEVAKDIEFTACDGEASGGYAALTATMKITNSTGERKTYHGTVNFLDASGKTVGEGLFHSGTLDPGQTTTKEIPAQGEDFQGELTCEVGEAEISDPK